MTVVGDIIRIKDCQTLFGQRLCNVFYYLVAAWTGNASLDDIITPFYLQVIAYVEAMQTTDLWHTDYRLDNITNGLDFAERTFNSQGTYPSSETQAPFIAASFRLDRLTKLTRPGFKRIAGIAEEICNDGELDTLAPLFTPIMAALAAPVSIDSPNPGDGLLSPVIVGRNPDGTYDFTRVNPVASAAVQVYVTSQNTRKVGR